MESIKSLTKNTSSRKKAMPLGVEASNGQNGEDRISRIAVSAYYKAQARGFQPGHELDDWLAAEAEEKQ